jgi:hypothetical protein
MRTIRKVLELCGITVMICLCIASPQARAADLDGSVPILCAFTRAFECDGQSGCDPTTVDDVNLPSFFKIEVKKNIITAMGLTTESQAKKETKITGFQRMDGKMVLQGVEQRGWSMVINEKTGKMALTASGDDEAFVLFGTCIPQ